MKYSFPQISKQSKFLTYGIVEHVLKNSGHIVRDEIDNDCDFLLFSAADVSDLRQLRKLREQTDKQIIIGGHFAINFWSSILYADYVYTGEIFDFANYKSVDEIEASPYLYKGQSIPVVSTRIDWDALPIVQIKKTSASYLGGVGCKNNCKFCHTAWTHRHQTNSDKNIRSAIEISKRKKLHFTAVSNEYEKDYDLTVKDMLGVDYIRIPIKTGGVVRIGIELATEHSRKYIGKPLSRDDIFKILQKATAEGISLRLFHIGGYNKKEDWEQYINEMCWMLDQINYKQLLHLQFTNLQYQNYTPLYDERFNIDSKKYLTRDDTKRWYDRLRATTKSVLVGPPSPFGHVAWRMGVELSRTREQIDFWMGLYNKRTKIPPKEAQKLLFDTGVLDTPRYVFKKKTGRINQVGAFVNV